MRLRLEATPDELADKGDRLVEQLACALQDVHPDLADRLHKALPAPPPELKYPVLRDLHDQFAQAYQKQLEAMHKDIGRVLDRAAREVAKSELPQDMPVYDFTAAPVAQDDRILRRIRRMVLRLLPDADEGDFAEGGRWQHASSHDLLAMVRQWREDVHG